jgi:hypothetical protein
MVVPPCEVQRRTTEHITAIDLSGAGQERDALLVACNRSRVQCEAALVRRHSGRGARVEKQLHACRMILVARNVQRRRAIIVALINLSSGGQEQRNHIRPAVLGGSEQRKEPIVVGFHHARPSIYEAAYNSHMAVDARAKQWRCSVSIGGVDHSASI